jgi:hypothetical protein
MYTTLPTDVRLAYGHNTTPGTLYHEYTRCGRKTNTYREITRHLHSCAKKGRLDAPRKHRRASPYSGRHRDMSPWVWVVRCLPMLFR